MGTKTDRNEDINLAASHHLNSILGLGGIWTLITPSKDRVGLDYQVVLRSSDLIPEITFFIQLKGRGPQTRKGRPVPLINQKGNVVEDIELEHLEFYMKIREPVFVVVVDVVELKAYWVHVQKYIYERFRNNDWLKPLREYRAAKSSGNKARAMPEIGIKVPARNLLSNTEAFAEEVRDARGFMLSVGIEQGMAHEMEIVRKLDPRFDVKMKIGSDGNKEFVLQANQTVWFTLTMPKEKGDNLVGRGLPVELEPGELTAEGSPHWDRLSKEGGILHFARKFPGSANLLRVDKDNKVVGRFDNVPCTYEGGPLELRFSFGLPNDIMKLSGALTPRSMGASSIVGKTNLGCWYNQRLCTLPNFNTMLRFVGVEECDDRLHIEFHIPGELLTIARLREDAGILFKQLRQVIRPLALAREIAESLNIDPITPYEFYYSKLDQIEELYEIGKFHKTIKREPPKRISYVATRRNNSSLIEQCKSIKTLFDFRGVSDIEYDFFGIAIRAVGVQHHLTNVRAEMKQHHSDDGSDDIEIVFVSTRKSIHTITGPGTEAGLSRLVIV